MCRWENRHETVTGRQQRPSSHPLMTKTPLFLPECHLGDIQAPLSGINLFSNACLLFFFFFNFSGSSLSGQRGFLVSPTLPFCLFGVLYIIPDPHGMK